MLNLNLNKSEAQAIYNALEAQGADQRICSDKMEALKNYAMSAPAEHKAEPFIEMPTFAAVDCYFSGSTFEASKTNIQLGDVDGIGDTEEVFCFTIATTDNIDRINVYLSDKDVRELVPFLVHHLFDTEPVIPADQPLPAPLAKLLTNIQNAAARGLAMERDGKFHALPDSLATAAPYVRPYLPYEHYTLLGRLFTIAQGNRLPEYKTYSQIMVSVYAAIESGNTGRLAAALLRQFPDTNMKNK